jgi:hypothetical protein
MAGFYWVRRRKGEIPKEKQNLQEIVAPAKRLGS